MFEKKDTPGLRDSFCNDFLIAVEKRMNNVFLVTRAHLRKFRPHHHLRKIVRELGPNHLMNKREKERETERERETESLRNKTTSAS